MRPGVESTHGVEFVGVWIVIGTERLASLARMIAFDVMAVGVVIVLVLKNVALVGLGVAAKGLHHIEHGGAIRGLFHAASCLVVPTSVAVVGVIACSGRGRVLIACHCRRALLHCRDRRPLLHGKLLLHGAHLCRHHFLESLLLCCRHLLSLQ